MSYIIKMFRVIKLANNSKTHYMCPILAYNLHPYSGQFSFICHVKCLLVIKQFNSKDKKSVLQINVMQSRKVER
jgi:hypothetical protein